MFDSNKYLFRKKVFAFMGAEFQIMDESGKLVLYAKQKAFKLKEDIRLFSDREMQSEVMSIRARKIIDISATYDVIDTKTGKNVGALQRKGLKSVFRDEWLILDINDKEVGKAQEDSMGLALVRRVLLNLLPQNYDVLVGEKRVMDIKQQFNPFVYKLDLVFEDEKFDKRMGFAMAVLLGAIEGRQE